MSLRDTIKSWGLEAGDMAIHFGVALAVTAAMGFLLLMIGWSLHLVWLWAIVVQAVFYVREALQQAKKNNPPANKWDITQWGPRGIAEYVCVLPAVFIVAVFFSLYA